jgi:hypothetical protein
MDAAGGPILSGSGNRVAFADAPGRGHDVRTNDIYVANADGTGQPNLVDSYAQDCFCVAQLDISYDGAEVISTDTKQLRIANADGSGAQQLIWLNGGGLQGARIDGYGDKVFFIVASDTSIHGTGEPMQRGLYVINADGTGRRQIVGPDQVAAMFGVPPDRVIPFRVGSDSVAVSADGSNIVFGASVDGTQRLLGVSLDGSGLHEFPLPPVQSIHGMAISGDGTTVAYNLNHTPCCSSPSEVGVEDFEGTVRQVLASSTTSYPLGFPGGDDRIQLSFDGSKLLLGNTSVLIDTATAAPLQLAASGGSYSTDPPALLYNGMWKASMNISASPSKLEPLMFFYIAGDRNGVQQLARMDLDPVDLGDGPSLDDLSITPAAIVAGGSPAAVSATVSTPYTIIRVSSTVLKDGLEDGRVDHNVMCGPQNCHDDPPGVFSAFDAAHPDALPGPRTVRVKAEVRDNSGRRQATSVEFDPFEVLAPSSPSGGHRDLSNSRAGLVFVNNNGPTRPTTNMPTLATDAQRQWLRGAQLAEEELMLQDSLSAGFRQTRGQDNDAFWSTVGHEDNALDPSAWAVLELATADRSIH